MLADRRRRRVSRLLNKNLFTSRRKELLQIINSGSSLPISERTICRADRVWHKHMEQSIVWETLTNSRTQNYQVTLGEGLQNSVSIKTIILSDESIFCLWTILADVSTEDLMKLLRKTACRVRSMVGKALWSIGGVCYTDLRSLVEGTANVK